MKIIVDEEAKAILEKICDTALKHPVIGGMAVYVKVKQLEQSLEIEKDDKHPDNR